MASSSSLPMDRRSDEGRSTEYDQSDPLFEGETLRISPQYLRRFLAWLAERRDRH